MYSYSHWKLSKKRTNNMVDMRTKINERHNDLPRKNNRGSKNGMSDEEHADFDET